jgi:hypothetical protein
MHTVLRYLAAFALSAICLLAADLTGTWDAAVESALGSGTPTFTFKQDGEKLTGEYAGALGNAKLAGTVKGDAVEFSFKVDAGGESIEVTYKGKAATDGKKLSGNVSFGALGEGTFKADKRN